MKHAVERGHRYRDIHLGRFSSSRTEWIVERVFQGTDGLEYALIVCASDLTLGKSLPLTFYVTGTGFSACDRSDAGSVTQISRLSFRLGEARSRSLPCDSP